ncbi:SMC-Scp complex subunit ScpB [Vallitaleaceae bacterium 9-2]
MEIYEYEAIIEAILFTLGEAVSLDKIATVIELDEETTKKILHQMMDAYQNKHRGIRLIELEGAFQLCTKKEYYEYIKKATNKVVKHELTEVLIETLSIIAYKQPLTKMHIEKIRGVKTDHAVNKLIEYGLIEEKGRLDSPGRPILFGTTEAFLRGFGLASVEELPDIDEQQLKKIRGEVEQELQMSFHDHLDEQKKESRFNDEEGEEE